MVDAGHSLAEGEEVSFRVAPGTSIRVGKVLSVGRLTFQVDVDGIVGRIFRSMITSKVA